MFKWIPFKSLWLRMNLRVIHLFVIKKCCTRPADPAAVNSERWTWNRKSDKFSLSVEYVLELNEALKSEVCSLEFHYYANFVPIADRDVKYFQSHCFRLLCRCSTRVITPTFDLIFISWPFTHECFWPSFFDASTQAIVSAALDSEQCRTAVKTFQLQNHPIKMYDRKFIIKRRLRCEVIKKVMLSLPVPRVCILVEIFGRTWTNYEWMSDW